MLLYEHVALSKVQYWVQPGKNLFNTLFLVLFKDEYQGTVWDLVQSTQPQADVRDLCSRLIWYQETNHSLVHLCVRGHH